MGYYPPCGQKTLILTVKDLLHNLYGGREAGLAGFEPATHGPGNRLTLPWPLKSGQSRARFFELWPVRGS